MDFTIPENTEAMRLEVRRLVDRELIPGEKRLEQTGEVEPRLVELMSQLGLFGLTIPEQYGGLELNCLSTAVLLEELGRAHTTFRSLISNNIGLGSMGITLAGNPEQKARYLPRLATGELRAAFALSEPDAGSDTNAIRTRAERSGDGWVLNGMKHFITNGSKADVLMVMAVTNSDRKARDRVTAFLVEKGTPGFEVDRIQETMGPRTYTPAQLSFTDCRVPDSARLGEVGHGLKLALRVLNHGRVVIAASAVGLAQRLLDEAVAYAKLRVQFGRPIADNQAIQFMLADMALKVHSSRILVRNSACLVDQEGPGRSARKEAAMAKLYATESLGFVADQAVQIFGGMGYMRDLPIERMYREARYYRIIEGTSEIQRIVIAREVLA